LGEDLWSMVAQGPAEVLAQTVNTQPVMLTAGVAVWRLWNEKGGKRPSVVAGHSLGEYAALVAAEAMSLTDAVPLVRFRAAAMQAAVPAGTGAMAAILSLDNEAIAQACREAAQGECVESVNFNANGQTVIAGHKSAVERAVEGCKTRGAKRAVLLPVSAPFHCALMRPAAEQLAIRIRDVRIAMPKIPVLNNVDVRLEDEPDRIRDSLVRQAYSPVRWVEIIQKFASMGVTAVAECGPGKVLSGMTKRCADGIGSVALADIAAVEAALASLE
jgi:[acyl-carrier-protein] S-malonyltransferase